jgi:hypothetical protein
LLSASRRTRSLYSAVNRRRVGFAATSGSGTGVSAAAPRAHPIHRRLSSRRHPCLTHVSLLSSPSYTNFQEVGVSLTIDKEGSRPKRCVR